MAQHNRIWSYQWLVGVVQSLGGRNHSVFCVVGQRPGSELWGSGWWLSWCRNWLAGRPRLYTENIINNNKYLVLYTQQQQQQQQHHQHQQKLIRQINRR